MNSNTDTSPTFLALLEQLRNSKTAATAQLDLNVVSDAFGISQAELHVRRGNDFELVARVGNPQQLVNA